MYHKNHRNFPIVLSIFFLDITKNNKRTSAIFNMSRHLVLDIFPTYDIATYVKKEENTNKFCICLICT